MSSLSSFIHMGGYAPFIWSSYAITLVVLLSIGILSIKSLKTNKSTLNALNDHCEHKTLHGRAAK